MADDLIDILKSDRLRLRVAWNVLRGRPVAYRLHATNVTFKFQSGSHPTVVECLLDHDPEYGGMIEAL